MPQQSQEHAVESSPSFVATLVRDMCGLAWKPVSKLSI